MALRGSVVTGERVAPTRAVGRTGPAPARPSAWFVAWAVASFAAALVLGATWGGPLGVGIGVVLAFGVVAASVDVRDGRLPDAITLAGGAVSIVTVGGSALQQGSAPMVAAAAGCLVLCGPILAVHLVSPDAMGFGDVKLGAVLGVVAGLLGWRWALLALAVASGITLALAALRRRRAVPFGPGLVAGAATSVTIAWISSVADGGPLGWEVATWR